MVLRNTFDIYKLLSLTFLFCFLLLHWLVNKRADYLVSRGSRDWYEHGKIMALMCIMNVISFVISYTFYMQFTNQESPKNENNMGLLDPFDVADMLDGKSSQ